MKYKVEKRITKKMFQTSDLLETFEFETYKEFFETIVEPNGLESVPPLLTMVNEEFYVVYENDNYFGIFKQV